MRSVEAGRLALYALGHLGDWKDHRELAEVLGILPEEAKSILRELYRKGFLFRDGSKYIRRWGM